MLALEADVDRQMANAEQLTVDNGRTLAPQDNVPAAHDRRRFAVPAPKAVASSAPVRAGDRSRASENGASARATTSFQEGPSASTADASRSSAREPKANARSRSSAQGDVGPQRIRASTARPVADIPEGLPSQVPSQFEFYMPAASYAPSYMVDASTLGYGPVGHGALPPLGLLSAGGLPFFAAYGHTGQSDNLTGWTSPLSGSGTSMYTVTGAGHVAGALGVRPGGFFMPPGVPMYPLGWGPEFYAMARPQPLDATAQLPLPTRHQT